MVDLEKVYGFLFIHKTEIVQKYFPLIKTEWNILQIHKDWHFAISELLKDQKPVDILTVVQCLRANNRLNENTAFRTSQATNDAPYVRIESLFNSIDLEYKVSKLNTFLRNFHDQVNDVNFSPDHVIQLCDQTKNMLVENAGIQEETNENIIDHVVMRHENAKNGIEHGIQLGWKGTHNKIILENIDVMVVGGRPAMGKTAWIVSLAKQLAFNQGKKCCIFSLEMSNEMIMRRLLACLTGIDSNKIKLGQCNEHELETIDKMKLHPGFQNLTLVDGSQKVSDITRKITELKNTNGLDIFMIDYLQKIIPAKSDSRYQEVTRISNDVKRLTMAIKIPCIAMAQLSRESARTGKRPTLPDLKESGEIEQDASIVAFLHRPEYYGETVDENGQDTTNKGEFLIAKNREGETGIVNMDVQLETSSWTDATIVSPVNVSSMYHESDQTPF